MPRTTLRQVLLARRFAALSRQMADAVALFGLSGGLPPFDMRSGYLANRGGSRRLEDDTQQLTADVAGAGAKKWLAHDERPQTVALRWTSAFRLSNAPTR